MVDRAATRGGDAQGIAEGLESFGDGVVRDAGQDPRGLVQGEGACGAKALRYNGVAGERVKCEEPRGLVLGVGPKPQTAGEVELELIQTHMTQKPVLRVEVGGGAGIAACARDRPVAEKRGAGAKKPGSGR